LKFEIEFETDPIKPGLTICFHFETLKHTLLPLFHVFQHDTSSVLPPPIQPTFPCPTHTIRPIHDTTTGRKMASSNLVSTKPLPKNLVFPLSPTAPIQPISILRSPEKPRSSQKKSVHFSVENSTVGTSDGKRYRRKLVIEAERPHRSSNDNSMYVIAAGLLMALTGIIVGSAYLYWFRM